MIYLGSSSKAIVDREKTIIQKFEYLDKEKSFLDEIKSIFHSFWRAIIWWKLKTFKSRGHKLWAQGEGERCSSIKIGIFIVWFPFKFWKSYRFIWISKSLFLDEFFDNGCSYSNSNPLNQRWHFFRYLKFSPWFYFCWISSENVLKNIDIYSKICEIFNCLCWNSTRDCQISDPRVTRIFFSLFNHGWLQIREFSSVKFFGIF